MLCSNKFLQRPSGEIFFGRKGGDMKNLHVKKNDVVSYTLHNNLIYR